MTPQHDREFRTLVQALMHAGWYRICQDPESVGRQWGFRQGHTLDAPIQECWVVANNQIEAMRIMCTLVRTQRVEEQPAIR